MTLEQLLFGVLPYIAVVLAVVVTIIRYTSRRFSYSSLSSQFLENKMLFRGSVPWHYGIIFILVGHLVGFLFPSSVLAWNGEPVRLYILEISALAGGFFVFYGLVMLIIRRLINSRIREVTSFMDVVLLCLLSLQVFSGLWTAIFYRWGSSWYAGVGVPYLRSLVKLNPDIALISPLPFWVQTHIVCAFLFIALIPFTRLVHFLSIPFGYFTRPYQVVVWNRRDPN